jgi:hypothetical protein
MCEESLVEAGCSPLSHPRSSLLQVHVVCDMMLPQAVYTHISAHTHSLLVYVLMTTFSPVSRQPAC